MKAYQSILACGIFFRVDRLSFADVALALGDNSFEIQAVDLAGNQATQIQTLTRVEPPDVVPPELSLSLVNDTGISNSDRLTKDGRITGQVTDNEALSTVTVSLDGGVTTVDITGQLDSDGTFNLDETVLSTLNGGDLPDGEYSLTLTATDTADNSSSQALTFTLDTSTSLTWGLDPASDTGELGDLRTEASLVTLTGQAEPGSTVTLQTTGATTTADADGNFSFADIALVEGTNEFAIATTDAAGNSETLTQTITRLVSLPEIQLTEHSDYTVEHQEALQIPNEPSQLVFTINDLTFDTQNSQAINDAFQISLLDENGNSVVHAIAPGHTAFLSISEPSDPSQPNAQPQVLTAPGVTYDASTGTVTVDTAYLPAGMDLTLDFRLVNNDSIVNTVADVDTATTVTLAGIGSQNFVAVAENHEPATAIVSSLATVEPISDFGILEDITNSVITNYGVTSLNTQNEVLYTELILENGGTYAVDAPLLVVIENLSDPAVIPIDSDGTLPDGRPYYDFSRYVHEDGTFDPSEQTDAGWISFHNPTGEQFSYDITVLGQLNQAPEFTSTPDEEAVVGQDYSYLLTATDANGDDLTYRLLAAPPELVLQTDDQTNETRLIWTAPESSQAGTYAVVVEVADGRGGTDLQTYTLEVADSPPNRPPLFVSNPVVEAWINQAYNYDADAIDPDGDDVTYNLIFGPEGMTLLDPETGELNWTPEPFFALGDTVLGSISFPGEADNYTFYGQVGKEVYFDPQLPDSSPQYWRFEVTSPSGTTEIINFSQPQFFRLDETGRYDVKVYVDPSASHFVKTG